jgi:uncharacterized protein YqgC (DUF456 family)
MLEIVLIALGIVLTIAGLVGCVLPVLPGPPLNWLAMLLLSWARDWEPFDATELAIWGAVAAIATALDYVVPAWGAKKAGASSYGVWGSVIGMIVGMIFFPPFGMLLGALLGAVLGELLGGKSEGASLKAGVGVFLGTTFGIIIKLTASAIMTYYYVAELL